MKNVLLGFVLLLGGCSIEASDERLSYVGELTDSGRIYFESLDEMLEGFEGEIYLPKMDGDYFLGSIYSTSLPGFEGEITAADFNFGNEGEVFTYTVVLAQKYDLEDIDESERVYREYYFEKDDYVYIVYANGAVEEKRLKEVADSAKLVQL